MTAAELLKVAEAKGLAVTVGAPARLPTAGFNPADPTPPDLTAFLRRRRRGCELTEAEFQDAVVGLAKLHGWTCYHTHDSRRSEPGFPDLVLAHADRGLVLFRELKKDTGRLTRDQARLLTVLSRAGADAGVWRPRDWAAIVGLLRGG